MHGAGNSGDRPTPAINLASLYFPFGPIACRGQAPVTPYRLCPPLSSRGGEFFLPSKWPGKAVLASLLSPQFGVSADSNPRGEDATRAGVHGLDRAPMAVLLPLHPDLAGMWRLAPEMPVLVGDEREPVGLIGELRLAVTEEQAGLERRCVVGLWRLVPGEEPDHRACALPPEHLEGLLEPACLLGLRNAPRVRRLGVPPLLGREERLVALGLDAPGAGGLVDDPCDPPEIGCRRVRAAEGVTRGTADVDRVVSRDVEVRRVLAVDRAKVAALQAEQATPEEHRRCSESSRRMVPVRCKPTRDDLVLAADALHSLVEGVKHAAIVVRGALLRRQVPDQIRLGPELEQPHPRKRLQRARLIAKAPGVAPRDRLAEVGQCAGARLPGA